MAEHLIGLIVPAGMTATGLVLLAALRIRPGISPAGDLMVSFLVGAGAITLVVLWVSSASFSVASASSVALNAGLVVAAASIPAAGAVLLARIRRLPALMSWIRERPLWLVALPLTALVIYQGWLLGVAALHSGPGWDGVFVWDIKAKYFLASGGVPGSFFSDASRQWSHITYPLLLPLTEALASQTLGGRDQVADRVVATTFALGLAILFHEIVRRARGPLLAALLTLVLITAPAFWSDAFDSDADLPVAMFMLAGTWFVYRWFDHGRRLQDMLLGGTLLGFAMWVKHEGVVVWAAGAGVMAAWTLSTSIHSRSLRWGPLTAYAAPALLLVPWWLSVAHGGVSDADFVPVTVRSFVEHANRIPTLLGMLVAQLTLVPTWGIAWLVIGAGIVLRPPIRSAGRRFLLVVVLAHVLVLSLVYTFSAWVPYTLQVAVSSGRVLFQIFPAGLLMLATGIEREWWNLVPLSRRRAAHAMSEGAATGVNSAK